MEGAQRDLTCWSTHTHAMLVCMYVPVFVHVFHLHVIGCVRPNEDACHSVCVSLVQTSGSVPI